MIPMVIDTDTASDDALALILALTNERVDVRAITVVSGNVPLEMGVQNALYTTELCGSHAPVYAGAGRPLLRDHVFAHDVHGADGMGDIGLKLGGREAADGHGVDVLIDLARKHPGELTLVTMGPLTNLALALRKAPDIATLYKRVVMMIGAADGLGNVTPAAEFNVHVDPEAADIVFRSGMPLEMVGWDVSRRDAVLSRADSEALSAQGPLGEFAMSIQRQLWVFCQEISQDEGIDMPDPLAMAIAIDPDVAVEVSDRFVVVETRGTHTSGATLVDHLSVTGNDPNTCVVVRADHARFMAMLHEACA